MKIYTKTGDMGETSLFSGERLSKGSPYFEALGTLDEFNAVLGLAYDSIDEGDFREKIIAIQTRIFQISADLAARLDCKEGLKRISTSDTELLEKDIDDMAGKLPPLKDFVFPSGLLPATFIHYARAICRRAERDVLRLSEEERINPQIPIYLNRLSDNLFLFARTLCLHYGAQEKKVAD